MLLTPATPLVRDGKRIGRVMGVEIDPATGRIVLGRYGNVHSISVTIAGSVTVSLPLTVPEKVKV